MWKLNFLDREHLRRLKDDCNAQGKPMVLWGWKRDNIRDGARLPESRTVYFSADLSENEGDVAIERAYFFLDSRAKEEEIEAIKAQVGPSRSVGRHEVRVSVAKDPRHFGYERFRMEVGCPTEYDRQTVARRVKGQPRLTIAPPRLAPESSSYDLSTFVPMAVCVGSGLSAESGLPLLGSIHNLFEVDSWETGQLIFGVADNLPKRMVADVEGEFGKFCQFTIEAMKAQPSRSHLMIADLYNKGIVRQVFTDNMDDILEKVAVPHTKTRLSIFPDRFLVQYHDDLKALLVVGVAVDRRRIIGQARRAGLKVIAVNPVYGVAPHSRNMDYMRVGDVFFKETAEQALPKIIAASGF